jgi:hypothetical protein
MTASFEPASLYGFTGEDSALTVTVPSGTARGSYSVTVSADEHGNSRTTTATFVVQSDAPTALPPTTLPRTKTTISSTTLPVRIVWSPATDASTAIAAYELQTSVDRGAWSASTSTAATVRTAYGSQTLGHLYQYRLRARDSAGNWSAWASGPTLTSSLVQDRSSAIRYYGTWTKSVYSLASGGSTTYAKAIGARARITFTGRAVAIIAPVGPTRGTARVYVDGVYKASISFRATSGKSRMVMYATSFATLGTHSIELRLTSTSRVDLDAFAILR